MNPAGALPMRMLKTPRMKGLTTRNYVSVPGSWLRKTSLIRHNNQGLFKGLDSPFAAARYHSLMVKLNQSPSPDNLIVTSVSDDRVIMGLSHPIFPLHGVQFHPESFLTENGFQLVENFLALGPLREIGLTHAEYSESRLKAAING